MGIPGLLKEIGRGERIALSKLAVEHLEKTRRPLRIAIDAAIWQFQNQAGQGGKNPALRTLFFRLLKILALPIHPVFIYDGKNKPLTKRGKSVTAYGTCIPNEMSKKLIHAFRFPYHTAPGEAEAECALLQQRGVVDAVMSQDVDAIMFGSTLTLRDWSKEGTKGNKSATHINVLRQLDTATRAGLDSAGMILVALLSGGDYNPDGLPGFGSTLACEIAKAGFGTDFFELIRSNDEVGLQEWRERLQFELETNESGYFKRKHKTIKIPHDFPNHTVLNYYTNPAVSEESELPKLESKWSKTWDQDIDISALRCYVADTLDWLYKSGARKFIRCLAPALLSHRLRLGTNNTAIASLDSIKDRRQHFTNDGMPEMRVEVIPGDIVGLDLNAEEDNPAYEEKKIEEEDEEEGQDDSVEPPASQDVLSEQGSVPPSPSKRRKSPPWDPLSIEKYWIPETILQLGVPALLEEWHQKQRDMLADPKKFATRKCPKTKLAAKVRDPGMQAGALDGYFAATKPAVQRVSKVIVVEIPDLAKTIRQPLKHPLVRTEPRTPTKKTVTPTDGGDNSPKLDRYFSRSLAAPIAGLDRSKDGTQGLEVPSNARYSALGIFGSDTGTSESASSTPKNESGQKHSRPWTPDSDEDHPADNRPRVSSSQGTSVLPDSLEQAGTSFVNSITISSSPSVSGVSTQDLLLPQKASGVVSANETASLATLGICLEVPSTITQRKKGRRRIDVPCAEASKLVPELSGKVPIESFFPPAGAPNSLRPRTKNTRPVPQGAERMLPQEMSTGLRSQFTVMKINALPRDSLPGTWKESAVDAAIAENGHIRSTRTRTRISCVDLTGD